MLKASIAAKMMAACVCPVVGSAAVTLSVPSVREAVHRQTAPRVVAKAKATPVTAPRLAERVTQAPTPCALPALILTSGDGVAKKFLITVTRMEQP